MRPEAWRGSRVLVTGHTGFKGAWLALWLERLGASVAGLSLEPPTKPSLHALLGANASEPVDVRDRRAVIARLGEAEPEVVFHLAARSLVRPAFADPLGTYEVNVLGTAHVLEAVRETPSVRATVIVTSDKVYAPDPDGRPHAENAPLGGAEPYSSSKAGTELVADAYRSSYGLPLATARAGNVLGGGDWATDRVVPDVLRALEQGRPVALRHPEAVRPWQHVLDPLHGYLLLAERLLADPQGAPAALNFGPEGEESCSVRELVERLSEGFGGKPGWRQDEGVQPVPETGELRLDASRARAELGWACVLDLDEVIAWTIAWHQAQSRGEDARPLSLGQIDAYKERL